jgi:hypothetical protein
MDTDLWRNLQALVQHLGRVPSLLYQRIEIPTSHDWASRAWKERAV